MSGNAYAAILVALITVTGSGLWFFHAHTTLGQCLVMEERIAYHKVGSFFRTQLGGERISDRDPDLKRLCRRYTAKCGGHYDKAVRQVCWFA